MEICVRLNDDCESDYTFQIDKNDTFDSKIMKMFNPKTGLARFMVLRPSLFYKIEPKGLTKSMHPGFLTEDGCLIYHYDCDKREYRKPLDLKNKKIWEQLWPGQLVLPQWELSYGNIATFVVLMLAWLYTDLPDVISPTPGICLTNQFSKRLAVLARNFGYNAISEKLLEETQINSAGTIAQWLFFTLHCLKVLFIALVLYTGLVNPLTVNPLNFYYTRKPIISKNTELLKETLRSVGWIGVKRATYDDYRDTYYNYRLEKAGGMVAAYKSGIMKKAATPGVLLETGEGFQTPLDKRFTESTFKTMEKSRKFVLSEEYLIQVEHDLKEQIKAIDEKEVYKINQEIRKFRRYGFFECGPQLARLVQLRQEVAAEKAAVQSEEEKKEQ
ncbi:LAFA_0E03686g1_1 [Lachancea sp. 'fantastica']|nr:LAFA_0E03686g1_1 [Lachancea sp. 'fantastica']